MAANGNGNGDESRMQDVNVPLILTIGVISSLLLIVIVFGIQAWFHFEAYHERQRKVYEAPNYELLELRTAQQDRLNSYRWADDERQHATIPIEQAMEIHIQRQPSQDAPADTAELAPQAAPETDTPEDGEPRGEADTTN